MNKDIIEKHKLDIAQAEVLERIRRITQDASDTLVALPAALQSLQECTKHASEALNVSTEEEANFILSRCRICIHHVSQAVLRYNACKRYENLAQETLKVKQR